MATVTTTGRILDTAIQRSPHAWWDARPLTADAGGTLSGTFEAADRATVWLIHKPTKQCIAATVCDASGAFSFTGLTRNSDDYLVVTANEPGAALTFDRVTPV